MNIVNSSGGRLALKVNGALAVCLLLGGCAGTFEQPDQPSKLQPENNYYSENEYKKDLKDYNDEVDQGDQLSLVHAKLIRDKMVTSIAADIDYNYGEYKGKVHMGRAAIATVGDAASLGLTAAVTVVGGSALKSILGAADTALKGTVQSYDNHFFDQKATEIVVNSMDAIRTTQETLILNKLGLPIEKYPFGEAKMDLIKLFFLGTREAGLAALEAEAGKKSATATDDATDAAQEKVDKADRFGANRSDDQVKMVEEIRQKIRSIKKGGPGTLEEGVAILNRAQMKPGDPTSLTSVVSSLNKLAAKADDVSQIKSIHSDFYP